ncbi:MAG TPA: hypothetical protein VJ986_02125, partial [Gaiellaceae bacterium]|nr:hypothetical protein [Gaiellaceae bacterium]
MKSLPFYFLVALATVAPSPAQSGVQLISQSSAGALGDAASRHPSVDESGRYVAFESLAANLGAGDNNGLSDIYLRDRVAGVTSRVSFALGGGEPDGHCYAPAIAGDGTAVAFDSAASNLAASSNGSRQVYVRDLTAGTTELVSVDTNGAPAVGTSRSGALSADGSAILFTSDAPGLVPQAVGAFGHVYFRDLIRGVTTWVDRPWNGVLGDGRSWLGGLSADGRYAVFGSEIDNLVPNDGNGSWDVFRADLSDGTVELVTVSSTGAAIGGITGSPSADGRYVAFWSPWPNLDPGWFGSQLGNVYVRDMQAGLVRHVSGNSASNNFPGTGLSLSGDGRSVAFEYDTSGALPDTASTYDVWFRDTWSSYSEQLSVQPNGAAANGNSSGPAISGNGRRVAFASKASDLVANDTNLDYDVFVAAIGDPVPVKYCSQAPTSGGCVPGILYAGEPSATA